jgi:murein DD-endopeptidase MepM/ murein hydrolase activator NlpD
MVLAHRWGVRGLAACAAIVLSGCGSVDGPVVWPISAELSEEIPLSSTFGPRVRTDELIYDFHRGIDIAVPFGSDVHAIAAGRVVQIEQNTSAGGMLVQLEHDGYFSNYIHLSDVDVDIGDTVDVGETIGESGEASNGFEHLHFEIRMPGDKKTDCVHPLEVLPYNDSGAPAVTIDDINLEDPMAPIIKVTVSVPPGELDLKSVTVATFQAPEQPQALTALVPLSEQTYDVEAWNRVYTDLDSDARIDKPSHEGIMISPRPFNNETAAFSTQLRFSNLVGPDDVQMYVKVTATDIHGNTAEVMSP